MAKAPRFHRPNRQAADVESRYRRWLTRHYPALTAALAVAAERFAGRTGVVGFGVGRPYSQHRGQYKGLPTATGGLCVQVFVRRKRSAKHLAVDQRIPRAIYVAVPGHGGSKRSRVSIDVVSVGTTKFREQTDARWPTSGSVQPGRIFSFAPGEGDDRPRYVSGETVMFGTVGCVLRTRSGRTFATSAGHVFAHPSLRQFAAPAPPCRAGCRGQDCTACDGPYFPSDLRTDQGVVIDAMLFEVPNDVVGAVTVWPSGFLDQFSTPDDQAAAHVSTGTNCFVLVERDGVATRIPLDLFSFTSLRRTLNDGSNLDYGDVWMLRFGSQGGDGRSVDPTICGDSGAPVFVQAVDATGCRLLGFHFLLQGGNAYAVPARLFFQRLGWTVPADFDFA